MASDSTRTSDGDGTKGADDEGPNGDGLVTYYTVLQVEESARAEEGALQQTGSLQIQYFLNVFALTHPVRKAYLRFALLCHPDRSGESEALTFRAIKGEATGGR